MLPEQSRPELTLDPLTVGEMLGLSRKVLMANLGPFFLVTAIATSPMLAWLAYATLAMRPGWATIIIGSVLTLTLPFIAEAAVVYGTVEYLAGRRRSTGETLRRGLSMLLPVLGVALVTMLLFVLGLVALIIPGLIVWCMLFVVIPAAVVEGGGVNAALKRSTELTKGYRWQLFGAAVVIALMEHLVDKLFETIFQTVRVDVLLVVATLAIGVFFGAFRAVLSAVAYTRLRRAREGVDADELARIFE
jgi:hypothetical protein